MEHFDCIYGDQSEEFDEDEGRRRFLLYIRPIINGTGNYYIEAETRDSYLRILPFCASVYW